MKTLMAYWWDTTEYCVPPGTILGLAGGRVDRLFFARVFQRTLERLPRRQGLALKTGHSMSSLRTRRREADRPDAQLKVDPATIEPEAALFGDGVGLDSIDALELSLAISQTYGYQLKSSDPEIKAIFSSLRALAKAIEKNRTK